MINYHPNEQVLNQFAAGELPVSISVVVASHVEICEKCAQQLALLTEQQARAFFESDALLNPELAESEADFNPSEKHSNQSAAGLNHSASELSQSELELIDSITAQGGEYPSELAQNINEIAICGTRLTLPRALKSIALKEWQGLGKLSRSRLLLEDGELRTSLLHIDKGGSVPTHTHKGFEITLLLQGSFKDEMGEYKRGDFVWLDGEHTHQPVTEEGCVCLTVSSDAIYFTQGVSQLLNPIGRFIY
ncbi:ChrR family anti-sigma-E factor [Shewanella sp. AS1]|uniref:ChrR family anti-sigma-E factor n=1 Tax=Shewanella sp. AS1 TaxID=2907626 RepID=UPI001F15B12D|nr:ChrR family anti-sigma-E factor [Shewanella sp. AS1]MCE9679478.1 ChrR family anti-sigma-E factor [Shewanella sp. AS1]